METFPAIGMDESGIFTDTGYIRDNGNSYYEDYDSMNIPEEYKVLALPKQKHAKKMKKSY